MDLRTLVVMTLALNRGIDISVHQLLKEGRAGSDYLLFRSSCVSLMKEEKACRLGLSSRAAAANASLWPELTRGAPA